MWPRRRKSAPVTDETGLHTQMPFPEPLGWSYRAVVAGLVSVAAPVAFGATLGVAIAHGSPYEVPFMLAGLWLAVSGIVIGSEIRTERRHARSFEALRDTLHTEDLEQARQYLRLYQQAERYDRNQSVQVDQVRMALSALLSALKDTLAQIDLKDDERVLRVDTLIGQLHRDVTIGREANEQRHQELTEMLASELLALNGGQAQLRQAIEDAVGALAHSSYYGSTGQLQRTIEAIKIRQR